jgi:hypothetical protein
LAVFRALGGGGREEVRREEGGVRGAGCFEGRFNLHDLYLSEVPVGRMKRSPGA